MEPDRRRDPNTQSSRLSPSPGPSGDRREGWEGTSWERLEKFQYEASMRQMQRSIFPLLIFIAILLSPKPVFASETPAFDFSSPLGSDADREENRAARTEETLFSPRYGRRVLRDARHVLGAPLRWDTEDWLSFSLKVAAVGTVSLLDRPIYEGIQRNRNRTVGNFSETIQPFGTAYSLVTLGGFYLAGSALGDPKAKRVALDGLSASFVASGLINPALKRVIGRSRPRDEEGRYSFHPFRGDRSFPSGHATQAFTVASVIAAHYDSLWIRGAAYGIATVVGFARISHGAHFTSDIVAGALIGFSVGRAVVDFNEAERSGPLVLPQIGPGSRGILLTVRF